MLHRLTFRYLFFVFLVSFWLGALSAEAQLGPGGFCLGGGDHPNGFGCCGDGLCEPGEDCSADCWSCGDGVCAGTETCSNCNFDCGDCMFCGDGVCNGMESCDTCAGDCPGCFQAPFHAFYRGEQNDDLYLAYSDDGFNWEGDRKLGNGAKTSRGPAAVVFRNRIYVFYRGSSHSEIYYSWSGDGETWYGNQPLGNGAETDEGIGATVFNHQIYVFSTGKTTGALWLSKSSNGTHWRSLDHRKITGDDEVEGAPGATVFNNELYVYYKSGGSVRGVQSANGNDWTQAPGLINRSIKDGVSLAVYGNALYLAAPMKMEVIPSVGPETGVVALVLRLPGTGWSDPMAVGGRTDRRPGLASAGEQLVVMHKGKVSNYLFHGSSDDGWQFFGHWRAVGATKKGGPALVHTP